MKKFTEVSDKDFSDYINAKQPFEVELPESIAKFQVEIPNVDFSTPQEVPPTSMIHTAEFGAAIMFQTQNDQEGRFIRFVAAVYWAGGRICYQKQAQDLYKLSVSW